MTQAANSDIFQTALAHHRADQYAEAEKLYRQILDREPNQPDTLHLLGRLYLQTARGEEGLGLLRRALVMIPGSPELHMSLGNGFADLSRFDEAIGAFGRAAQLNPNYCDAWNNLGSALMERSRFDESLGAYAQALRLKGDLAEAHLGAAYILLLTGKYEQGFAEFEWRWRAPSFRLAPRNFSQPQWKGEPLNGRTLLLHAEQGHGDTIQCLRYVPLAAARGARVVVGCQPELAGLVASLPDVKEIKTDGTLPQFHVHCPMMSLPRALNTRAETIPASPYLLADPTRAEEWRKKLHPFQSRLKVGLAWAGRADNKDDARRSIRLLSLARLADTPGVTFFSLQKGPGADQAANPPTGMRLIDLTSVLHDFSETAALICGLDLVIAVDTAVAHLAGAMGKKVWLLLPYRPDWRWMLDREDSPWYPTLRLFRQKSPGDWAGVIRRVAQALSSSETFEKRS